MTDEAQPGTIQIPDFVVRQVGTLQIQLAAAQQDVQELSQQLAAAQQELMVLKATKPESV